MAKRIAIVDDNHFLISVVSEKLSFFDDLSLKFSAKNGKELLQKLEEDSCVDLILMDIEMPLMNGIEATGKVKSLYPQIKILMLTVFDNDENIYHCIQAGADGYLLKELDPQTLYDSIINTLDGGAAMSPSIAIKTLNLIRNPLDVNIHTGIPEINLSKRELEVLKQLSQGLSYTKIAKNLFLSPNTVRKHIENIYKKLNVSSKLEAVEKAKEYRLI